MKIEHITTKELLSNYLDRNYHDKGTLVIDMAGAMDVDLKEELDYLKAELKEIGFEIPTAFIVFGYVIIQMPPERASVIIRHHSKGGFRITSYFGGTCINKNQ